MHLPSHAENVHTVFMEVETIYPKAIPSNTSKNCWGEASCLFFRDFSFLFLHFSSYLIVHSGKRKDLEPDRDEIKESPEPESNPGLCSYIVYTTEPPECLKDLCCEKCSHCSLTRTAIAYMWKVRCSHF